MDKLISDVLSAADVTASFAKSAFVSQLAFCLKNTPGVTRGNFIVIMTQFRFP